MLLQLRTRALVLAAVALAAAPLVAGQQASQGKQEGAAKPAAASAAVQQTVSLPVTGLTKEETSKVQTALTALQHKMWCCQDCKHIQDEKGTCTSCKKELVAETLPVLSKVTADVQQATLTFVLHEGMRIQLSEVQRTLGTGQVKVDPAKLVLAKDSVLYVQGPPSEEAAKKLEQALKASKLFERVEIQHKADSRDYHVQTVAAAKAPTHAEVTKAVEGVGDGFKLTDVGWFAPKPVG